MMDWSLHSNEHSLGKPVVQANWRIELSMEQSLLLIFGRWKITVYNL